MADKKARVAPAALELPSGGGDEGRASVAGGSSIGRGSFQCGLLRFDSRHKQQPAGGHGPPPRDGVHRNRGPAHPL